MPVLYPIWLGIWFEVAGSKIISLFLSPIYWFVLFLCVLSGYGMWEMKRWSWYVFLSANLFVVYQNAFVAATYGNSERAPVAFLTGVLGIFLIMVRVGKELRVPYFLPNIRWWESDPARKVLIPVSMKIQEKKYEAEIMDISLSGCFIKCPDDFPLDERIDISFTLFGSPIECNGTIVWLAASTVTHPKGLGVKFGLHGKVYRRKLRTGVQKINDLQIFSSIHLADPVPLKAEPKPRLALQSTEEELAVQEQASSHVKG